VAVRLRQEIEHAIRYGPCETEFGGYVYRPIDVIFQAPRTINCLVTAMMYYDRTMTRKGLSSL
jgi:hypothetical protein